MFALEAKVSLQRKTTPEYIFCTQLTIIYLRGDKGQVSKLRSCHGSRWQCLSCSLWRILDRACHAPY